MAKFDGEKKLFTIFAVSKLCTKDNVKYFLLFHNFYDVHAGVLQNPGAVYFCKNIGTA